jgi:hypothetical protein
MHYRWLRIAVRVNHLGHFALTGLLLDHLLLVAGSRVVTVSSVVHRIYRGIRFNDIRWDRDYQRFGAYNHSKLANLMFIYASLPGCRRPTTPLCPAAHQDGETSVALGKAPKPQFLNANVFFGVPGRPYRR